MRWLSKFLWGEPQPSNLLDQLDKASGVLIVTGYRALASQHGCAPTSATSDQEIIRVYRMVASAFHEASQKRGEHIPAGTINYIVWKFLLVKEMMGSVMLESHLEYEVQKYLHEGLRPDYRKEITLF